MVLNNLTKFGVLFSNPNLIHKIYFSLRVGFGDSVWGENMATSSEITLEECCQYGICAFELLFPKVVFRFP